MMKKAVRPLAVLLAALFVFAGAAAAESIKVGFISRDLNYLPFFVGQKKGFYAAEGLQVDLVFIGRPDLQLQAVVAGVTNAAPCRSSAWIIIKLSGRPKSSTVRPSRSIS